MSNELPLLFSIGDSISNQYGPYLEQMLRGFFRYGHKSGMKEALEDLDHPRGANCGDSSATAAFVASLAARDDFAPAVMIVNCGLHDIKTDPATGAKQVPLAEYRANLARLARSLNQIDTRPVWIRTTSADEAVHNKPTSPFHRFAADVDAVNAAADEIMRDAGIPLLDLYTFTLDLGPDLYCDHVHFHDHIREKQAAFIGGYVVGLRL